MSSENSEIDTMASSLPNQTKSLDLGPSNDQTPSSINVSASKKLSLIYEEKDEVGSEYEAVEASLEDDRQETDTKKHPDYAEPSITIDMTDNSAFLGRGISGKGMELA
jgi:hypothetical protein